MADLITLARPYAKAAFQVALADNALASWSSMLAVSATVSRAEQVRALLISPHLSTAQQAGAVIDVCGDALNEKGRNFISLLAENKRLALLPEIAALFEALKAQQEKSVDVQVTSAFDLAPATIESLATALRKRLEREIRITSHVDATLIGGVIIKAGDLVIDSSVRGKLNQLAEAMNA